MYAQTKLSLLMIFILLTATLTFIPTQQGTAATDSSMLSIASTPLEGIVQVAVGGTHTCVVTNGGGVKCWGKNNYGQLGDGTNSDRNTPTDVVGLGSGVTAVAAGESHTCALMVTGGMKCWGANLYSQVGIGGGLAYQYKPANVAGLSSGVKAMAASRLHTCALLNGGAVMCWGENSYGQLGRTGGDVGTPGLVTGLSSGVAAINAGDSHTCAVTTGGAVKCWGRNYANQLGDGTKTDRSAPVDVSGLNSGIGAVAAGASHTCALTTTSAVKCWGSNAYGQLGVSGQASASTPVDVTGLSSGVTVLSAGKDHNCVLTSANGIKCWGRGLYGALGNDSILDQIAPVDVIGLTTGVTALDASLGEYTCAVLTASGGVKCWGRNDVGQLGDGSLENRLTPIDVLQSTTSTPTTTPTATSNQTLGESGPLQNVAQVAVGGTHTCVVTNGGGVKCWGKNNWGQLGDGTYSDGASPTDVIGLGSGVTAVAAGESHTCALTITGGMKCWGANLYSQLGIESGLAYQNKPVSVIGLTTGVKAMVASRLHTCALLSVGAVMCWGENSYGQLGRTGGDVGTPGLVTGLSSGVAAINAGDSHTCAVTTGGAVKCWGRNYANQLGDGTKTDRSAPVDVSGLNSGIGAVAAGASHTCALTTTGTVKCWGSNAYGQLGVSGQASASTPVDVTNLSSGVTALSAGKDHNCVLTAANGIKCWGRGLYGALGNDSLLDQTIPVDVIGLTTGVTALDASLGEHTCAVLTTSGGVKCWGRNDIGQLGDGSLENRLTPVDVLVVSSVTPTDTPTATQTTTPTNTATPPAGSTPPTATNTPTVTPTTPPSGVGDGYEEDNTCSQARVMTATGVMQEHTFHTASDADWVAFSATAGEWYLIEAEPPAASPANLNVELYATCTGALVNQQDYSFANGVRFEFQSPTSGLLFLKLTNHDPAIAGNHVQYQLAVRALPSTATSGALILVAGSISANDTLQPNIYHVTDRARQIFLAHGYDDEHIYYVAPDTTHPNVDAAATITNLRTAITTWALDKVDAQRPLTLYFMDHGARDLLYLNKPEKQQVSPSELDRWLAQLEATHSNLLVNVIIEACYAGSFINHDNGIAKARRIIITSTNNENPAWASLNGGAVFSDKFIEALANKSTLAHSYYRARAAIPKHSPQRPWLDANGNAIPNEPDDFAIAAGRGFGIPGTFADQWPPLIVQAVGPGAIENGRGQVRAQVLDDEHIKHVWAVIYPPAYVPPTDSEALVRDEDDATIYTIRLQEQADGWYSATHAGFDQLGVYRVVFHVEDDQGLNALPVSIDVVNGTQVSASQSIFLPIITR